MNVLSKILIVAFIGISLKSVSAQDQANSINTDGIVKIQKIDVNNENRGTGFFVSPHILITNFHVVHDKISNSREEVLDELFMVHPKTGKRIPVHFIQALGMADDLAALYVSEYKSPVYYEFAEASPEEEAYIVDHREKSLSILEGKLSPQYPSEISSRKTLLLSDLKIDTSGLSGSPVFSIDGTVIGVFNSQIEFDTFSYVGIEQFLNIGFFTEVQKVKELLARPSLNCVSLKCITDALREASNSKEGQYARAEYEERTFSKSTNKIKDFIFKERQISQEYWLKKSAEQGFSPAMFELALIYLEDQNNEELFEEWMVKAGEKNFDYAQLFLSGFLLNKKGDVREGIKWAQKAMEHGLFLPLDIFDNLVTKKVISKQDYRQYVEDFAERGHPEAQEVKALYDFKEAQSDRDRAKAMNLLKQAKYPRVLYELSLIYKSGLHGVKQDIEKAKSLEKEAIERGYVPRDRQLVHKLIERGYFLNLDVLEDLVAEEIISDQDYRDYVEDSAKRGYVKAQRKQIYFFLSEVNVNENEIDEAVDYAMIFLKELNYAKALYKLSAIYTGRVGKGLKNKAIELGYVEDEEVGKITSHVRSAVDNTSLSCQRAFENIKN